MIDIAARGEGDRCLIRAVGLTHNPAWPEAGRYV